MALFGGQGWPLSTSAGWFPHTMPCACDTLARSCAAGRKLADPRGTVATGGPKRHTGSHNITVRGIINGAVESLRRRVVYFMWRTTDEVY